MRERCAKLPVHDWLARLLANYDREKMESDLLRRLLREDRAELRQLETVGGPPTETTLDRAFVAAQVEAVSDLLKIVLDGAAAFAAAKLPGVLARVPRG